MTDQEIVATIVSQAETPSLFDELPAWCPRSVRQSTTESSRISVRSAPTMRCSGYWKQWVYWRSSREKRLQQQPRSGNCCGKFWKHLRLSLAQLRSGWSSTRRGLNCGFLNCRRNWKQAWTHPESQSCWAKVCGSPSNGQGYQPHVQLFCNPALN